MGFRTYVIISKGIEAVHAAQTSVAITLQSLSTFLEQKYIDNVHVACKILTIFHFKSTEVLKVETMVKEQVASKVWELYEAGLM